MIIVRLSTSTEWRSAMKFYPRLGLFLCVLLACFSPKPAQAFLPLNTPPIPITYPVQPYSADLEKAIALLSQEQYAAADVMLKALIQANPTEMPARDFYYISQMLQDNWLNLLRENADRAYLNLPNIGFFNMRDGISGTVIVPEPIQTRIDASSWGSMPDVKGAIAQIKQEIDQSPNAIPPRLTLAALYRMTAYAPGESENPAALQQSYTQLRDLVRRYPNDAQLRFILAENLPASTERTAAYQESIRLNPQLIWAWMGYARDAAPDSSKIIQIYQDAIQVNPDRYELHYALGTLFQSRQQTADAIASLHRTTELQPSFNPAWSELFAILQQDHSKYLDQTLLEFERVSILNPLFSDIDSTTISQIMVRADRVPEAVSLFNRIGRQNPKAASRGFLQLSFLLGELAPSRKAQIIRLQRRAYRLDPIHENLRSLASALIRHGQPAEGEALMRQFIAAEPPETAIYVMGELGFAIVQQDVDRALKYLDEINAANPAIGGYEWSGSWLVEQKRWAEAQVFYERAAKRTPWYNTFLAQILAEQGQLEEAIAMVRSVRDSLPKEDPNYYGLPSAILCDLLARDGKLEEAIAIYQEATRRGFIDNYFAFGEFLKEYQKWDGAIEQYQQAIKKAEEQLYPLLIAKSYRGIGQALIGKGELAEAKAALERARALFQEQSYLDIVIEIDREIEALP
jgi:tetratricopeptide (TPR) repeat protein